MITSIEPRLDYSALIAVLAEKTAERKIDWRETAEDDVYLAAVKGQMTFEVGRHDDWCELIAKDVEGKTLFRFSEPYQAVQSRTDTFLEKIQGCITPSPLGQLHDLARRIARRLDEKLDASIDLVNSL